MFLRIKFKKYLFEIDIKILSKCSKKTNLTYKSSLQFKKKIWFKGWYAYNCVFFTFKVFLDFVIIVIYLYISIRFFDH